jgi:hypothetical protein
MQCDNDLYAGDSNVMIKVHTAKESRLLLVGACIPYQKKPRFLGGMHFDHDIAVTSIQVIITLHRRLNIMTCMLVTAMS